MRGRSRLGLCKGGEDTATRRNHPGDRSERVCPRGSECSRRLQPAITSGDVDLHGRSGRGGCAGLRAATFGERSQPMNVGFKIPTRIDTEPAARRFDLRQYLNFVWRHWMLIGTVAALALVVALIYLASAIPHYTAATQVLLEQREKTPGLETGLTDARYDEFVVIENQLAILKSDSLLRRVVIKERLAASPQDPANPTSAESERILRGIDSLR